MNILANHPLAVISEYPRGWRRKLRLAVLVLVGIVAATTMINWRLGWRFQFGSLKETERRGNKIVAALKEFHSVHGRYPLTLRDLTPHFLERVPPPAWGLREWIYARTPDGFDLRVHETIHTGDGDSRYFCYYDKWSKWETGD